MSTVSRIENGKWNSETASEIPIQKGFTQRPAQYISIVEQVLFFTYDEFLILSSLDDPEPKYFWCLPNGYSRTETIFGKLFGIRSEMGKKSRKQSKAMRSHPFCAPHSRNILIYQTKTDSVIFGFNGLGVNFWTNQSEELIRDYSVIHLMTWLRPNLFPMQAKIDELSTTVHRLRQSKEFRRQSRVDSYNYLCVCLASVQFESRSVKNFFLRKSNLFSTP